MLFCVHHNVPFEAHNKRRLDLSTFLVVFPKGLDRDGATSAMSVISSFATKLLPCIGSRETFAFIVESDDEAAIREVLGSSRKSFGVYSVADEPRPCDGGGERDVFGRHVVVFSSTLADAEVGLFFL